MSKTIADVMLKGPHELREGEYYFTLVYYRPDANMPCIETYVYIGKNVLKPRTPSEERWYFQDPESYQRHGSFVHFSKRIKHTPLAADEDGVCHMFDLDGLIQALSKIRDGER